MFAVNVVAQTYVKDREDGTGNLMGWRMSLLLRSRGREKRDAVAKLSKLS